MPLNVCLGGGYSLRWIPGCYDTALDRVFPGTSDDECGPKYQELDPNDTGYCETCPSGTHCVGKRCQLASPTP